MSKLEHRRQLAVLGGPPDRGAYRRRNAHQRIVGVRDRRQLGAAQLGHAGGEDVAEQLFLGLEVPVEDALANAHRPDDVGDRGGLVPALGESGGGHLEKLRTAFLAAGGQASVHGQPP